MNRIKCEDAQIQKVYWYIDSSDYSNLSKSPMVRIIKNDPINAKIVIQNVLTSELMSVPTYYTYFEDLIYDEIKNQIELRKNQIERLTAEIEVLHKV